MPTLYNADRNTGKYLEGMDTQARENPMYNENTHDEADRYIYNRKTSSLVQPMACDDFESPFLVDGAWIKKIDRVGQYYYTQDGSKVNIVDYDVDIPAGCLQADPESNLFSTHDGTQWILDQIKFIAAQKKEFWNEYIEHLSQGFEYESIVYQCTPDDMNDWLMLKNHIETLDNATEIQIRAADNSMITITVGDYLTGFSPAIGNHVLVARQTYWAKVDAI